MADTTYAVPAVVARVDGSDLANPGATFLTRLPDGPIHRLNGPAAIVHDIAPGRSLPETVAAVAETVGLDPATVEADVRRCLDDLETLGLLEIREEADGSRGAHG